MKPIEVFDNGRSRAEHLKEHMFRTHWWYSAKTVSDEGFSITLKLTKLLYEIDGKSMSVNIESDGRDIDVFHSSMRSWIGDTSAIDPQTDERNVDNLTRALESRGLRVHIVS